MREEQERVKFAETQRKANQGEDLSPEEQAALVKRELSKFGVLTREEANELVGRSVSEYMEGNRILNEVSQVIESAVADGKPKIDAVGLLEHMKETGIKNPSKAYKDRFEVELDKLKEEKVKGMKPEGLYTTQTSTAGAKEPQRTALTKENLSQQLGDFFRSRGQ